MRTTRTDTDMASGEHCLIRRSPEGQPRVKHYDCDEFPDGTVTNPITGKIVEE